jgi:spermidine synthase
MARDPVGRRSRPGGAPAIVALSGAGALLVGFVSVRQLDLVFGSTPQANAAMLTGLVGGVAIGSLAGGRVAVRVTSPIKLYGLLALGSGLVALAGPLLIGLVNQLYRGAYDGLAGSGPLLSLVQVVLALIAAGPVMALWGATLSTAATARAATEVDGPVARWYSATLAGVIVGAVASGLVLIELLGLVLTLVVGAGCFGVAGLIAFASSSKWPPVQPDRVRDGARRRPFALALAFVSGLTAVGYLVLWLRLLASGTGNPPYVFTVVVAIFLAGLAIGARVLPVLGRRILDPRALTVLCEVGIAALAIAGLVLVLSRPAGATAGDLVATIRSVLARAVLVVLPPAILMGSALTAAALDDRDTMGTPATGALVAAIALGAIGAILLIPLVAIPAIGSPAAVVLLALVSSAAAGLVAVGIPRGPRQATLTAATSLVALACAASLVAPGLVMDPSVARILATPGGVVDVSAEDAVASVQAGNIREFPLLWVAGTPVTPLTIDARLMTILPLIARPQAQRVLIVPFGMGAVFRLALVAGLTVDSVEGVPSVPGTFGDFFPDASSRMAVPRGHLSIADARNQVELTQQRYDIIATDPPTTETAEASALSSREYYQAGHRLLNPGGVMVQVVRFGGTLEAFRNQLRTFHDVFPHTLVALGPGGYGALMFGSDDPIELPPGGIADVLNRTMLLANLSAVFDSPEQTIPGWTGRIPALAWITDDGVTRFVGPGPLVTDDHPIGEFDLLGRLGSPSPPVTPELLRSLSSP